MRWHWGGAAALAGLVAMAAGPAAAQSSGVPLLPGLWGGYTGPGGGLKVFIKILVARREDERVVVEGQILYLVYRVPRFGIHYIFGDDTGRLVMWVPNPEPWPGAVDKTTRVRITGEIDVPSNGSPLLIVEQIHFVRTGAPEPPLGPPPSAPEMQQDSINPPSVTHYNAWTARRLNASAVAR